MRRYWSVLLEDKIGCTSSMISGSTTDNINNCIISTDNVKAMRISTTHKVKGQTFDAVMLVLSKDKASKVGHWEQLLYGNWRNDISQ